MGKKRSNGFFMYLLLAFFAAVFILPLFMVIFGSFKENEAQIMSDLKSFRAFMPVGRLGLENYTQIFTRIPFFHFMQNSARIVAISILAGTFVTSQLAYSLARLKFRGRRLVLAVIISLLIIPSESIMMAQLSFVHRMGLVDTITAQVFPAITDVFIVFLFYQGFLAIPHEIEEAAIVDGCSYPGIYARIVMPLSKPTIITTVILSALSRWGDVLWPTLVTRGRAVRPIAIGVNQLFADTSKKWGDIFAFCRFHGIANPGPVPHIPETVRRFAGNERAERIEEALGMNDMLIGGE
jgi:multiple sugar transport system permease protein